MKKFLAIFFSLFYLAFSSGAVLQLHYCMEEISVSQNSGDECNVCHSKEKKDCCKDEVKFVKVDHFQKSDLQTLHWLKIPAFLNKIVWNFEIFSKEKSAVALEFHTGPPVIYSPSIYILNCNFRI